MKNLRDDSKNHSNIEDISTDPLFLHLVQIHDTAFPTGSFAHSFGMETYIQNGTLRDEEDLKKFLAMYIRHNLASGDGILIKEAYCLAKEQDNKALIHLENICHGIKLSPETRTASARIGRQFLHTVYQLTDNELITQWYEKLKNQEIKGHYAIAYGIYTAVLGADLKTAIEMFFYSSITALVQNAVRAVPLGQMSGVKTVFALLPLIRETVNRVMTLDLDDLDNNSIALEIASMKHEFLHSRLFMS
ncbi:urease accessory protein UreF [Ignatzschineria sp. LJL83]